MLMIRSSFLANGVAGAGALLQGTTPLAATEMMSEEAELALAKQAGGVFIRQIQRSFRHRRLPGEEVEDGEINLQGFRRLRTIGFGGFAPFECGEAETSMTKVGASMDFLRGAWKEA